jgi:hypothetical protein
VLPLLLGTLLAVGALVYVLFPLFVSSTGLSAQSHHRPEPGRASEQEAVVALREIEFDRETGKLSDGDYAELKARYTERAVAAMRATGAASGTEDAAEAAVLAYKSRLTACFRCGPRPEPDAVYCSNCGSYLPGACGSCGSAVSEPGAAFCTSCGRALAA